VKAPKPPQPPAAHDNVIALSQFRDRLLPRSRADALFASADPERTIRALAPDEFFYVINDLGFPEAMEILLHGTAEQVQTVLDFSIWEGDRVSMDKADDWLAALVEAEPKTLSGWAQGIDVELLALLVRQRARIYDLTLEDEPEEPEGLLWHTPDGFFAIDVRGQPDQARVTQRLLDGLYRYSPPMMRRLLVGMRAESDAELEEAALRWRSGRMADLGFADLEEAMVAYQELDPASVTIPTDRAPAPAGKPVDDARRRLPAVMTERLSGSTPFARGVAGLANAHERGEIHGALVLLANRVLSANRVAPGDDEAVRAVLIGLSATLDLAVEFLARGAAEREVAAVTGVPLLTLHRLGVSLTGKLARLAWQLVRKNPFASLRPAIDIFEALDAEVLASLTKRRPLFPRALEAPPAAGERPFATLADLATATRAVERAAAALQFVVGLGVRPAHLAPEALAAAVAKAGGGTHARAIDLATIDTGTLARTLLVARLLDLPGEPLPVLGAEAVQKFTKHFNSGRQLSVSELEKATSILCKSIGAATLEGAHREVALAWLESLCPLGTVLQAGPQAPA
jgi:hypothetical protein